MKKNIFFWTGIFAAVFLFFSCKEKSLNLQHSQQALQNQHDKTVNRIVCLSPAGAEILCEIGAYSKIIARTDFCNFPEEMLAVESIGGFDGKSLSVEKILMLEPELVYGSAGMHDFLKDQLESFGIKVYLSNASTFAEVEKEFIEIGRITDCNEGAGAFVKKFENTKTQMKKTLETVVGKNYEPVKVYYEVWNAPFMTCGNKSFINEIIETAGGKNVFDYLDADYPQINEEAVIFANPEVIIVPDMNNIPVEIVAARKGWENIDAVKNKKIYFVNADVMSRPGPRIIDAIFETFGLIYQIEY